MDSPALLAVFVESAGAQLGAMRSVMLRLAAGGLSQAAARALLNDLAREAHTLRGGAAVVGLHEVKTEAGAVEDVVRDVLHGSRPVDASLLVDLRTRVDGLTALVESIERPSVSPTPLRAESAWRRTILCVEDDPTNVALVRKVLALRPSVRLEHATSGGAALERLRAGPTPDLVLLDLHLPGIDGEEVLRTLRAELGSLRGVPVVVSSADASTETRDRMLAAGAAAYLEKPFDLRSFLALVDTHCGEGGSEPEGPVAA